MDDVDNFSCFDQESSSNEITPDAWVMVSEGKTHEETILASIIMHLLIVVVGLPWNTLVLTTIIRNRLFKKPTYILLLNLVVSDLLSLCLIPFTISSNIRRGLFLGNSNYSRCQICHTIIILLVSLNFVSYYTVTLMSIDRLMYLKWPLRYKRYSTRLKYSCVLLAIWASCIFFSAFPTFGIGEIKFVNELSSCALVLIGRTRLMPNIYYGVILSIVGVVPFVITLTANIWVMVIIRRTYGMKHSESVQFNLNDVHKGTLTRTKTFNQLKAKYNRQQIRLAQVFGGLFAANVLTWVPIIVIVFVGAIGQENLSYPAFLVVIVAYLSQSAIHPMVETCLIAKARSIMLTCLYAVFKKKSCSANEMNSTSYRVRNTINTIKVDKQ